MIKKIKSFLPKKLLARLLLIFLIPLILIQSLLIFFFYDRHWEKIIIRFSNIASNQVSLLVEEYNANGISKAMVFAQTLNLKIIINDSSQNQNSKKSFLENKIQKTLENRIDFITNVIFEEKFIELILKNNNELISIIFPRKYLLSETPTILFLWMISSSLILSFIAFLFLRIQVRAIHRLAKSAEDFGQGKEIKFFKTEGATEIRMAGTAFIKMSKRINNYISQRTSFLAGISHDLGTIITRIKLQLELMNKHPGIDSIKNDIETMQMLLKEYLDYSENVNVTKYSNVIIYQLIHTVINSSKQIKNKVSINCNKNLSLRINRNSLYRIIFNLIENAAKYSDKILISAKKLGGKIVINIEDNGPGIPLKYRKKIFRPFFKIDASRNLNQGGSGLGLSIARELVKKLDGNITVLKSQKLKGSCFSVKLKK